MPAILVKTNAKFTEEEKNKYAVELSHLIADVMSKPIQYVMAVFQDNTSMAFAGNNGKAAFIKLNAVGGVNAEANKKTAKAINQWFVDHGFDGNRVFIVFQNKAGEDWAHNGNTF